MKKDKKIKKDKTPSQKEVKKNKKNSGILWFLGISAVAVVLLISCQLFFENTLTGNEIFYENTKINGIDVGGMSVAEAENVVLTDMLSTKKDIEIELVSGDMSWILEGKDFEVSNKLQPKIKELSKIGHDGNFFENIFKSKQIEENGTEYNISYTCVLADIDDKIDQIIQEVEHESKPACLVFTPNEKEVFSIDEGQKTVLVKRDQLRQEIDEALKTSKKVKIEIPTIEIDQQIDIEQLKNSVGKRSEFSTS